MDDLGRNIAAPLGSLFTPEPSAGPSQILPQSWPLPSRELASRFAGWITIGEQRDFYDDRDCLDPCHHLASEKLQYRGEDDVVIFDYSLDPDYLSPARGNPPVEEGGPSSRRFGANDDIFFRVPKNKFIRSNQFDQIINPGRESPQIPSRGARLGIIDFPQCYDTYDDGLLKSMGARLGLLREGGTAFMSAHLQRAGALPGRGRFRTGISLLAPFKRPSEFSERNPSRDRIILFVSFPYFGGSSEEIGLDPESESVLLMDFRRLGIDVPHDRVGVRENERDNIGKILVHQARYMIFDNYTMATFRSKEDSAKDQVPLHRFQERIGAFRAMIHMIANRVSSELRTLERLQASLHELEEEIDERISDAEIYEDQEKQKRVRDLLTDINRLSAVTFAVISVVERQIAVLQDLHSVFATSYRTRTREYEKRHPLRGNPFHKNVAPIPILSENPEQIWPNALDTIDEVIRGRKSFINKVKDLVERMDIRRQILIGFLKCGIKVTAAGETKGRVARQPQSIVARQAGQSIMLFVFTVMTTFFLPLIFCTLYFGMNNIKKFHDNPLSPHDFWRITIPICSGIILVAVLIIIIPLGLGSSQRIYDAEM
ncbi:hypothetical protein B9Z19DRAFT_1080740 [Tuber borchii]|uniref:Uncharacterized protein n=1 Tax=Tuber borchii TaxID=42251 RepID=A0A2T6ZWJ5_TUBBO|nr:hypothetical protein B9Z19DRAFT_1080740 [Tuber borchii]